MSTRTLRIAGSPVATYSYKTPVLNTAPSAWTEWAANDFVTHIDHSRGSGPLARLTYQRLSGGEPQKIWYNELSSGNWNVGESVTMTYPVGLRVGTEDWSTTADLTYTYNDAGSRLTRGLGSALSTATYKAGFQFNGITGSGGAVNETWGYDAGGRVTTLNRGCCFGKRA